MNPIKKHITLLAAILGLLPATSPATSPAATPSAQSAPQAVKKPNIVYILLDDAGYGDFGCYGQKNFATPNVDRMASEGMKFTRHYSGAAVCAPARCVLMTGLHTGHSRVRANGPASIPDTDLTVARLLQNAGYRTACIGKYGLGMPLPPDDPQRKGFEYFFGYVDTAHAHNGYPTFLIRNGEKVPLENEIIPGSQKKPGTGVATAEGRKQWAPQLLADDVQRYLGERAKDPDHPFFLYYTPALPHANNEAGKDSPLGHGMETPSYGEFADRDWPDVSKGYAAAMKFVDDQVGAVINRLKQLGLDDNTIVMISSDNGPHKEGGNDPAFFKSSGGLKGIKRDLTEGGVREPFIVRWPGKIKPGTVSEHVSGFQDLMPTAADLAGVKVTSECDGISFLPALLGNNGQQKQHPYLFWYGTEKGGKRSVLQWPWKLLHYNTGVTLLADESEEAEKSNAKKQADVPKPLEVKLFNLETDPFETKDVAAENPELVTKLESLMKEAWRDPS